MNAITFSISRTSLARRHKRKLRSVRGPPPDLAIEIDITQQMPSTTADLWAVGYRRCSDMKATDSFAAAEPRREICPGD